MVVVAIVRLGWSRRGGGGMVETVIAPGML